MKKLKEYEEEVDIQVKENCPELADTIDLQSIKDIYHQAIKEILEEVESILIIKGEDDRMKVWKTLKQSLDMKESTK